MAIDFITSGYIDVKIPTKVKRGLTPWRAWRKQWCEIKRLDSVDNGIEITLKGSWDGNSCSSCNIPRNAVLCRTESRSKQFAFGIFTVDRQRKPLLFLSGVSETNSQLWMYSIRRLLSFVPHISVPKGCFYVSLVDNAHSRAAKLSGTHGILNTGPLEVTVKDPYTNETRACLKWHQLLQFHHAATNVAEDERKVCVLHTSKEFNAGAGQLYFYCQEAPHLLQVLVSRGKIPRIYINSLAANRRYSRSEGDLREEDSCTESPTSPVHLRSQSGSDDSGVRVSMASDDSSLVIKCKMAASMLSVGLGMLVSTPGGSEVDNESTDGLLENEEESVPTAPVLFPCTTGDHRRESGVSLASGVYEEIPDVRPNVSVSTHHYEDPAELIPPPLPPRQAESDYTSMKRQPESVYVPMRAQDEDFYTVMK